VPRGKLGIFSIAGIFVAGTKEGQGMRHVTINLKVSPEQGDLIDHAVNVLGTSRSTFMLKAACNRAQAVALGKIFFNLAANEFKQFAEVLDAPPGPNPALERLLTVKAPWCTHPGEAGIK
jgi:uncharacterized protein (DUF1778 family)